MEGYKYVANVHLIEDCNKKDYYFALYQEDFAVLKGKDILEPTMVVVNPRNEDNRILGIIKEIIPIENYKKARQPTAQVVGIVNMNNYIVREKQKQENNLIKKEVVFLIRKKLHLEKHERFRFSNQKDKAVYYFDDDMLVKEINDRKREASGVSLNYLLSNEVDIYKV